MLQPNTEAGVRDYPSQLNTSLNPIPNWTNHDNIPFYEEAALGLLQKLAVIGGLDTCCDIQQLLPYIKNSQSLLEVGAGYGRVLDYLTKQNYKGEIFAIERGLEFYKILQKKFKNKINLFHKDLYTFFPNHKFDVILWLWSGIADFSQLEQPLMLEKISSFLTPNGMLIIDSTPPRRTPVNAIKAKGGEYLIQLGNEIGYVYCISTEEIKYYAEKNKFKKIKMITYKTNINRTRILHFLQK